MKRISFFALLLFIFSMALSAQKLQDTLRLKNYEPRSIFNVTKTKVLKPKFTIIDAHSHDYALTPEQIKEWVANMDSCGIEKTHILSCNWIGRPFAEFVKAYEPYKDRFAFWCSFDYTDFDKPDWLDRATKALVKCKALGAVGVGEMGDKGLGDLYGYPTEGAGIHIDDPKLQPLLKKCGELGMPINIHIAEPRWMFEPLDNHNDGLINGATWNVDTTRTGCLGYYDLVKTLENALAQNPKTTFIACHYLNMNQDLVELGKILDKYPNLYIDIAGRVGESASTPRATRAFLIKYADRILFGTDNGTTKEMYRNVFRVLETSDEHFYIPEYGYHWYYSAFHLPKKVLKKIYYQNAQKLFR